MKLTKSSWILDSDKHRGALDRLLHSGEVRDDADVRPVPVIDLDVDLGLPLGDLHRRVQPEVVQVAPVLGAAGSLDQSEMSILVT